jgi:leucyl aminopeptidase
MIELSTLTGACMVALGNSTAGLFSNDDHLAKELIQIGQEVNEPLWQLPINEEHRKNMEGKFSDLSNSGKGYFSFIQRRFGGASKAAAFLVKMF